MLLDSRVEIYDILAQVQGVDVVPSYPGSTLTKPTIVYTRTGGKLQRDITGGEMYADEYISYTLEVISGSLAMTEALSDEVNVHMVNAGFVLNTAAQSGPQKYTLMYTRTMDRRTGIVHGRSY